MRHVYILCLCMFFLVFVISCRDPKAVVELPDSELNKLQNNDEMFVTGAGGIDYEVYNNTNYDLKEITIREQIISFQDGSVVWQKDIPVPLDTYYVTDGSNTGKPMTIVKFSRQDEVSDYSGPTARIKFGGFISAKGVKSTP
jgi:hypothetical protein